MSADTVTPKKFSNFDVKFHYAKYKAPTDDKPDAVEVFSFATQLLDDATGMFAIAMVRCNPKDNFCRKTGRALAEIRLKNFIQHPDSKTLKKYCSYIRGVLKTFKNRTYWSLPDDFKDIAVIHWDANETVLPRHK